MENHINKILLAFIVAALSLPLTGSAVNVTPSSGPSSTTNWEQNWNGATVSDGSFFLPAAVSNDVAIINQGRTIVVDTAVGVEAGDLIIQNTIGDALPTAFVEVRTNGVLTAGSIIVSSGTDAGNLTVNGGGLITANPVTLNDSGVFNVTSGSFLNNGVGSRSVTTGNGTLTISGGTFTANGAAANHLLTLANKQTTLSGGTVDLTGGQFYLKGAGTTLTVDGDAASITVARFNNTVGRGAGDTIIEFDFNATGISSIDSTGSYINLSGASLNIDGTDYMGGAGVFSLFKSSNFLSVPASESITGFAGFTATTAQSGNNYELTLVAVPEPSSLALFLFAGLGLLHFRRLRSSAV